VGADLIHADTRTDGHNEANMHFLRLQTHLKTKFRSYHFTGT